MISLKQSCVFLYVTECHKCVSSLFYHFNSSPPLLWLHAFFIISVSVPLLRSISPLYVLFPGASTLISACLPLCLRKNKRQHSWEMQRRKGGQLRHEYIGRFPAFIHINVIFFYYHYYCRMKTIFLTLFIYIWTFSFN